MAELRFLLASHLERDDLRVALTYTELPDDAIELVVGPLLFEPNAPDHPAIILVKSEEHRALVPGAVLFVGHAIHIVSCLLARSKAFAQVRVRHVRHATASQCCAGPIGLREVSHGFYDGQRPERYLAERAPPGRRMVGVVALGARRVDEQERSEERRVGKECRSRWSPYH